MNKTDKEIDTLIKNVINNEKIPVNIYQEAFNNLDKINLKSTKHKSISKIIKIVACLSVVICISIFSLTLILRDNKPLIIENNIANQNNVNNENVQGSTNSYAEESKLPVATKAISIDSDETEFTREFVSPIGLDMVIQESQYIAVVSLDKILYYTNYQPITDEYSTEPFTISKVTTKKVFKGKLPEEFEMVSRGGILSLSQYEKGAGRESILKMGLDKMSEQYKKETYIDWYSTVTRCMPKIEAGKNYLVYMRYNAGFEKNQVLDFFIYEYDIENDRILNHETNEWIDFHI